MAYKDNYQDLEEQNSSMSKINAAGLINSTLERLWSESYAAMAIGNYSLWNVKLDSIWAILGGDEPEGGEVDKEMTSINMEIYDKGSLNSKVGKGFAKLNNPNNSLKYHLLLKKALFLRRLQNKQGKGTAYTVGDEDDFE